MKKNFVYFLLAILAVCSCQDKLIVESIPESLSEDIAFTATIEDSADSSATKVFADDQLRVLWNVDDRVSIFNKNTYNQEYRFDGKDGDNAGEFAAVPDNGAVTGNPLEHIYALYPHNSTTKISNDGVITATLPAIQNYKANSFGIGANTMVSVTDDNKLMFKNVGGYLSFKFYGNNISVKRITLKGNNGEKLAGKASITMAVGGTPTVEMQADATESITLTCETPVMIGTTAENPTEFWFVIPPTTFTQGFTVTVTDSQDRIFEKSTSGPITISRNNLSRMSPMEVVPVNAATELYSFLPNNIGKETITGIEFHVKDATVTDHQLSASIPVYYSVNGTTVNIYTTASYFDISHVTSFMFNNYSALKHIDLSSTVTPTATSMFRMFYECQSLESIQFGDWDTHGVLFMQEMFAFCDKLQSLDLSFMDTRNVRNMSSMFFYCRSLASLNIDSFITSKVTDMSNMFNCCRKLAQINVGSFDTSEVMNMCGMFCYCDGLLSLDLKSFNTSKVTDMASMFNDCVMLTSLDLSSFVTENVKRMQAMFHGCSSLKSINLSSFNTSGVEDFSSMFYDTGFETLDLSNFQTSSAKDMTFMFGWSRILKELDISSFTSESLQTAELMFQECTRLQKLNLGAFDLSNCDCTDTGTSLMRLSKSGAIRCLAETRSKLEESISSAWVDKITWLTLSEDINGFTYTGDPNLYYSTDFSKHETVKKLYSATKGKGIDIVLMGDAYSDRMIANGRYDEDMELAVDAIFKKEPMASFKDMFNVYIVYLVSDNEVLGESTALDGVASGSGYLQGYASACVPANYRILATGNGDLSVSEAIVIINSSSWPSGYATMTWTPNLTGDYGVGYSSVVVGRGDACYTEEFQLTVAHEFGHSFAKLADEYWSDNNCQIEDQGAISGVATYGWYRNVDIVSDPNTIKWSAFLNDYRYANEGLGV